MSDVTTIRYERGDDGIVTLVLDDPSSKANTMNDAYRASMSAVLDRLEAERESIRGVVLTAAKRSFFAGGDLRLIMASGPDHAEEVRRRATQAKGQLRRLEKLGVPVVAALNGSALGGGAELALACHHRVLLDAPGVRIGFPEVTLGLLPGGGGIVRSTRLVGILRAVHELLLTGAALSPAAALEIGLVDELATDRDDLVARAKAWVLANPDATQPWDRKGFEFPGGDVRSPQVWSRINTQASVLTRTLKGAPLTAPHHILHAAFDCAQVDVDTALAVETRYYVDLVTGQTSKNIIQGSFLDRREVSSGASRPTGQPTRTFTRVGVLGAGMMGAGIAYSCAQAGLEVVLKDVDAAASQKGLDTCVALAERAVNKGGLSRETADALLSRITATGEVTDLAGCDAVIEAVFENEELKKKVFAEVQAVIGEDTLLASNTSTLPIGELAAAVTRPDGFVGLHFFSPVPRMELVEIIRGAQTSEATLAQAFDLVRQIGKLPIVVNDSRGFFTSRVFGKYIREGVSMLADGVPPASIEQASLQAGYPAPVLQLVDEVSLSLTKKIREEAQRAAAQAGQPWDAHPCEPVYDVMVDEHGRTGRAGGAGFYDYDENGRRTGLWPGLEQAFGPSVPNGIPFEDLKERLLFSEVVEALRCFHEGVISSVADANVGSLLGISFPGWTGGVVQFVKGYPGGPAAFEARAHELASRYGHRFTPPAGAVDQVVGAALATA